MPKIKVFISSGQNEFAVKRIHISEEAHLNDHYSSVESGFKVVLWRRAAKTGQVPGNFQASTDHDSDHDTDYVDELIKSLILVLGKPKGKPELMTTLGLRQNPNFRENYLQPSIEAGYVEMTLPDKPQSKKQKYQLTPTGQALKERLEKK